MRVRYLHNSVMKKMELKKSHYDYVYISDFIRNLNSNVVEFQLCASDICIIL